ncbi:hypothetical protein MKX01_029007, partial [Papaver californicum]
GQYVPVVTRAIGQPRPTCMTLQSVPSGHDMHGYAVDDEDMMRLGAVRGGRAGVWSTELRRKGALGEAFSIIWI